MKIEFQNECIEEAWFITASPEEVYRQFAAKSENEELHSADNIERVLLLRDQPLIDLALAQYASDSETLSYLWEKANVVDADWSVSRYRKGLRAACLANATRCYFGARITDEELKTAVETLDLDELHALVTNSRWYDILTKLYFKAGPFADIDDDRWSTLVAYSKKNARLRNESPGDDYDMEFHSNHRGILHMLEHAPATRRWMNILYDLILSLNPRHAANPSCNIDSLLTRWSAVDCSDSPGWLTSATFATEFGCYLAGQYGRVYRDKAFIDIGDPNSTNVAIRCAYYGKAPLTPKEIIAGLKRDGDLFALAATLNTNVTMNPKNIAALRESHQYESIGVFNERMNHVAEKWGLSRYFPKDG